MLKWYFIGYRKIHLGLQPAIGNKQSRRTDMR